MKEATCSANHLTAACWSRAADILLSSEEELVKNDSKAIYNWNNKAAVKQESVLENPVAACGIKLKFSRGPRFT